MGGGGGCGLLVKSSLLLLLLCSGNIFMLEKFMVTHLIRTTDDFKKCFSS